MPEPAGNPPQRRTQQADPPAGAGPGRQADRGSRERLSPARLAARDGPPQRHAPDRPDGARRTDGQPAHPERAEGAVRGPQPPAAATSQTQTQAAHAPEQAEAVMAGLRIIFAGSGEFGVPTLKALIGRGEKIVQVVSQPDRPAGRGRALTPTPISQFAIGAGLPLLRTENISREPLPEADVMVVIAFGQKLAEPIVNRPRLGSVNLHASRLPKYRGAAPINWAIVKGEAITGNSVIRLAQRMDSGAILGQSEVPIGELETAGELHDRLAEDGARLVPEVLDGLAEGKVREVPQDETHATQAPKLFRDIAKLEWERPATELARH